MSRPIPPYLKLRADEPVEPSRCDVADVACLGELCQAFSDATGWPLRYVPEPEPNEPIDLLWSAPVNPGVGVSPGHLRIDFSGAPSDSDSRADWHAVERMAGAIAELANELVAARHALWQREAELATAVPVMRHEEEQAHLAARLEATLRAGARAIGCDAAALYLLDEATSELKLRSAWGLPIEKFLQPARKLADQMADLEALLGHAVALESPDDMVGPWRSPEAAEAAVCVPVSSPTVPLGTLWLFSRRPREFSDDQTNLAEVIAGKLASDLEREVLLHEQTQRAELEKQVSAARITQQHQLPITPPPLAGWSTSGWAAQSNSLGGAFYDWRMADDATLIVMLGDACESGIEAALASAALRAALRADDGAPLDVERLLARANRVLWESSAGGWWAGLWLGEINLTEGSCTYTASGRPTALWLRPNGWASFTAPSQPLGLEPALSLPKKRLQLSPGESIIVCNRGVMEAADAQGRPLDEAALAHALQRQLTGPAETMIDVVRQQLQRHAVESQLRDRSILVVKRLPR